MATPSSSGTTPSPRPQFLQASAVPPSPSPIAGKDGDQSVRDERQRAIQKFFANAEISQVRRAQACVATCRPLTDLAPQLARGLRTRLTYATFKATHNLAHNTLRDLEAQTQGQSSHAKLPIGKAGGNHYNNPATLGNSAIVPGTSSRGVTRKGSMLPPPSVTASATQSLFSSLLQPPPSKRARTIHNPHDPPVPPPTKPRPATPNRKTVKQHRTPTSSQVKSKARKDVKGKKRETPSSNRVLTPQTTLGSEDFVDNDDDMKAAATLTSLLHSRPSMSVTASSPRSSMSGGSEGGSTQSYSHFAQSSARTTAPTSIAPSHDPSFNTRQVRSTTPPTASRHARTQSLPHVGSTTPKAQAQPTSSRIPTSTTPHPPSDTEAADLMLFLATSPSPVRPSTTKERDGKDMPAFGSLSGTTGLKGRVLFPGSEPGKDDRVVSAGKPLRRDPGGGFNSLSALPSAEGGQERSSGATLTSSPLNPNSRSLRRSEAFFDVVHAPSDSARSEGPSSRPGLLPAPVSPTRSRPMERSASVPISSDSRSTGAAASSTPGSGFNLHEYLNVSPSPAGSGSASKLSSLRANVGRKLFEEHHGLSGGASGRENMVAAHGGGLGAGIDLVKSSV